MFASLLRPWRRFRATPAGSRFQSRHRRQRARARGPLRKTLMLLAGSALIVLGIALLVLPGPGLLCLLLGALIVAEESGTAARLFDRLDLALERALEARRQR